MRSTNCEGCIMFHVTREGQILFDTDSRIEAVNVTRHFRRIERRLGSNRPVIMDRVS